MSKWIAVEERLPGEYENVQVAYSEVRPLPMRPLWITTGSFARGEWEVLTNDGRQNVRDTAYGPVRVTHWQPLPTLPGAEQ